jgi:transcriptional regulator with XRE-family HTH domain
MERTALVAARVRKHWTQQQAATRIGVDWNTLSRWERGVARPRSYYIDTICELYEMTAGELGLVDATLFPFPPSSLTSSESDDPLRRLARNDLSQRFMSIMVSWHLHKLHPNELQTQIVQATEENMLMNSNEEISRREALRRLAFLPIDVYGLSAVGAVLTGPFEEMIAHCAAGITACWYLGRGKELPLASAVVSTYIPTLQAMVSKAQTARLRQPIIELLVQCFVLKAKLARHVEGTALAIPYAKQAVGWSEQIENIPMRVLAYRTLAAIYFFANQWDMALQMAEKARALMEGSRNSSIPNILRSFVYSGLASYQAHQQQEGAALVSLEKATETFFASSEQEELLLWVDHHHANLLENAGVAYTRLGKYQKAIESFQETKNVEQDESGRVEVLLYEVKAEIQRDDQPRALEWCAQTWTDGIERAKEIRSEQCFGEAMTVYTAMRSVWPKEQRVKELRDRMVHW